MNDEAWDKFNDILSDKLIDKFRQDMKREVHKDVPADYSPEAIQMIDNVIELCAWQAAMTYIEMGKGESK